MVRYTFYFFIRSHFKETTVDAGRPVSDLI